ncbi:hypothetical protein ElyMa_001605700 [Elysia marginata]|uniref:Uncharacterized protein n=1 Tax=Elysia marginata TaxID=1093978 RepID=A0AAV4JJL9_9GAST|nr:hypothetical protein ElyMa_001605700 [Elysia marginata]
MLDRRSPPQQPMLDSDLYGPLPGYDLYPDSVGIPDSAEPSFDMLSYINSLMSPEEQYLAQRQAQNEAVDLIPADTVDPYQFVAALWNEAYERGNEEAQEIVRLLYDRVSHDSNPDDMGEIRDILSKSFKKFIHFVSLYVVFSVTNTLVKTSTKLTGSGAWNVEEKHSVVTRATATTITTTTTKATNITPSSV